MYHSGATSVGIRAAQANAGVIGLGVLVAGVLQGHGDGTDILYLYFVLMFRFTCCFLFQFYRYLTKNVNIKLNALFYPPLFHIFTVLTVHDIVLNIGQTMIGGNQVQKFWNCIYTIAFSLQRLKLIM